MKRAPFPVSNRALAGVIWIALAACGPPAWRGGIHARLAWSPDHVRVVDVPPDSPAERAGLRSEDLVVTIDGRPTTGLSRDQVQLRLSGEVGSVAVVEVLRGVERVTLAIVREPYVKPSERPLAPRGY